MKLVDFIRTGWESLQLREQRIILAGSALILVTGTVLIFSALVDTHLRLQNTRAEYQTTLGWIEEQAGIAAELANNCADIRIVDDPAEEVLALLARRNQVEIETMTGPNQMLRMDMTGSDGNAMLRFAHQAACQGFAIHRISVAPAEGLEGQLYGRMELNREI